MLLYYKSMLCHNEVNPLNALTKANLIMDIPGKIKNSGFLPGTVER